MTSRSAAGTSTSGAKPAESGSAPFREFAQGIHRQTTLRAAVTTATRRPEPECVQALLEAARLPPAQHESALELAGKLARRLRDQKTGVGREGLVQGLIQEFSLSSQEGVALMCLAEALLRIPDAATRDALIRDKLGEGNWESHVGRSESLFVNAATWGLMLTGKLIATHTERGLASALTRVIARSGEPIIRKGVDMAMRLMGEQFVTGETIAEALAHARKRESEGFRYSYDMLGEAAMTEADAQRYLASYRSAIVAIGEASAGRGIYEGPGISIKLSALHPRYSRAQFDRAMNELYPRLLELTLLARKFDIGLNIDAEEADRLELSLDLLEKLCFEPALTGWNGIGFVVQAYQKRCPFVLDCVIDLARRSQRRLMIRLVKGAYWDSEIKRAQIDGLEGYPVYTRKAYTDVSYIACARKLLAVPEAIYPQFATHNAHTLAAICCAAGANFYAGQYEFQCLHGMGEPLYSQVVGAVADGGLGRPCRIYAPVGTHETLLAYLVRRLLENGANTSFVNRIADESIPIAELIADPVDTVERMARAEGEIGMPHPSIPLPRDLYGAARANSHGIDLANEQRLDSLSTALLASAKAPARATPIVDGLERDQSAPARVLNPADHRDVVGEVFEASESDVEDALAASAAASAAWQATAPADRAAVLERAADQLEAEMPALIGLIVREAGKTVGNAIGEVREAVDFLRYYAAQVRSEFSNDTHRALGPIVCISPWNFPLAIFTGQMAAALAAGNTVLAKPAEQTPLIAARAVRVLLDAGVPGGALQLLPGRGETVGAALVADSRIRGVMFTGSTDVARLLQRGLAGRLDERGRPLVLVAETGGQNAMIVDSSALAEQVVADVLISAFDSAGQRCSALRLLCLQEEVADRVTTMLDGALQELRTARPDRLSTDVGPVIDAEAQQAIEKHIARMRTKGRRVRQPGDSNATDAALTAGTFVRPTIIELERIDELTREVFGPVLHLVRYRRDELPALIEKINATGYGLTLGIHTRIDETIDTIVERAHVGNQYVNRNMVGAVVGVQPFGGHGLSGTGPKAGGPLTLRRLLASAPPRSFGEAVESSPEQLSALHSLRAWLTTQPDSEGGWTSVCRALATNSPAHRQLTLPGPTGERNAYALLPREAILSLAHDRGDLLFQLAVILAVDSRAIWFDTELSRGLRAELPVDLQDRIRLVEDERASDFDVALIQADGASVRAWTHRLAQRTGPIAILHAAAKGERGPNVFSLESLVIERTVSINTAAAGGNASLMTIG